MPGLAQTGNMAPSIYTPQNIMAGNVPQQRIGSGGATGSGASRNQYVGGGSRNPIGGAGVSGNPAGGRTGGAGATAGTGGGMGGRGNVPGVPGANPYQVQSPFPQNPVDLSKAIVAPPDLSGLFSNPIFAYYLIQAMRGGV